MKSPPPRRRRKPRRPPASRSIHLLRHRHHPTQAPAPMADLTLILDAIQRGEPDAAGALLAQVYAELRQLARAKMTREQPGHTLQPTALVHEAWLRLGD